MKKIVSAAVAASLLAGAAFADVTVSSNFRIRPNLFQLDNGTELDDTKTLFSLDNSTLGLSAADTLTFKASNDYAGVTNVINTDISGSKYSIDQFWGYLKFGALTLTGGKLDSRRANRVTTDQNNLSFIEQNYGAKINAVSGKASTKETVTLDATESTGIKKAAAVDNKGKLGDRQYIAFAGAGKLGVNKNIFAAYNALSTFVAYYEKGATAAPTKLKDGILSVKGVDSDNITAIEGTKNLSFVADYVLRDIADGTLQFWASLNKKDGNWSDADWKVNTGYAFRAEYIRPEIAVEADFHVNHNSIVAAGFLSPKVVDGLSAVLGFTFATDDSTGKDGSTYWAIDARGRYKVTDELAAGLYINYTNASIEDADAIGLLDAVLNVNYKVNDTLKLFAEGEFAFNTNSDVADLVGHELALQAGALITAGSGAEIDAAVRYSKGGLGSDLDLDVFGASLSIPVVMRIRL